MVGSMNEGLYAFSALICGIVIYIVYNRTVSQESESLIGKRFSYLLRTALVFCIIDACWGFFQGRKTAAGVWILVLFSYCFHAMSSLLTYQLFVFTIFYFDLNEKLRDRLKMLSFALLIGEFAFLVSNFFSGQVFSVSVAFVYHSGPLRYLLFIAQMLQFIGLMVMSIMIYSKSKDKDIKNHAFIGIVFTCFIFIAGIYQLLAPNAPAYSCGFMLSCLTIYAFTITQERENLLVSTKALEMEKENNAQQLLDYEIIKRIAGDVDYVCIIDKESNISTYQCGGLFNKYMSGERTRISFVDFDLIMRKLMKDKDYVIFAQKASKEVVFNRLKLDDSYNIMVNIYDGEEEFQYRVSFFLHPNEFMGVIMCFNNITNQLLELKEKEEALLKASIDGLTGLLNKVSFEERVNEYIGKKGSVDVGFIFLDMDHFKDVNDNLGHAEGDLVLQEVSEKLKNVVRRDDLVSRQGGDEFCLFIPHISKEKLEERVKALHEVLKDTRKGNGITINLTASIGCVYCQDPHMDYSSLRAKADESMYNVKKNGRDGYELIVF